MILTFLGSGTSQGVPMIGCNCEVCLSLDKLDKRLRSSVVICYEGKNIVIDAGPDFRYQMLREKIIKLDAILITHAHKDHIGGLDDVRAYNYITDKGVDIYCEERVFAVIKKDFDYAFGKSRYPGVPDMMPHIITPNLFYIDNIKVIPIRGYHYKLPVLGYRIADMAYLTDMNSIKKEELDKLIGLDTLIINALRREEHISHFTLEQALEVISKVKPRRAYLTHLSHQIGLHKMVEKMLPKNVFLAYDKLKIEI